MNDVTRRTLLQTVAVAGAASLTASGAKSQSKPSRQDRQDFEAAIQRAADAAEKCDWSEEEERDRERVLGVGFTEDEATCWLLCNRAAAKYLALPVLHPSDRDEVTLAIHEIQNRLLSRPTYRRYLQAARGDR